MPAVSQVCAPLRVIRTVKLGQPRAAPLQRPKARVQQMRDDFGADEEEYGAEKWEEPPAAGCPAPLENVPAASEQAGNA